MCNDDITKLEEISNKKLIEVLNWLQYKKYKNEKANEKALKRNS